MNGDFCMIEKCSINIYIRQNMLNFDFRGMKGLVLPWGGERGGGSNIDIFPWFGICLELHFVSASAHVILVQNVSDLSFRFLSF